MQLKVEYQLRTSYSSNVCNIVTRHVHQTRFTLARRE